MRMKRYIKPEIQVINVVQTEQIMAVSGEDSFVSSDNITLNAPSSAGKTYLTNEISKLFPKEDMIIYSKITPTAFYYSSDAKYDK